METAKATRAAIEKRGGQRIEAQKIVDALRSGELDSVIDDSGTTLLDYKRLTGALAESEQRFEVLLTSLPVAAYTCDPDGLITSYNQKAVELWGREPTLNDPLDKF